MPDAQKLRILVIGASGVLGRAVVDELKPRHEIITAGSKSGDIRIDIADPASIVAASDKIRSQLGWKPEHDNLDLIVEHALMWEAHLAKRNAG